MPTTCRANSTTDGTCPAFPGTPGGTRPQPHGDRAGREKHRRSQVNLRPAGLRGQTEGCPWSGTHRDRHSAVPVRLALPHPPAATEMSPSPVPSMVAFPTVPIPLPPGEHPESPPLRGAGWGAEGFRAARGATGPRSAAPSCARAGRRALLPSRGAQGCTPARAEAAPPRGWGSVPRRGTARGDLPKCSPDAEEGSGFVHLDITHRAVLVRLQVANDAGFADCGERLGVSGWTDGRTRGQNPAKHPAPLIRRQDPCMPAQLRPHPRPRSSTRQQRPTQGGFGHCWGSRRGAAALPRARGTPGRSAGARDTHRSADTPRWWWRL